MLKFKTDRFSSFREILVTDFQNTVLRKTRLKFHSLLGIRCHFGLLLSNALTRLYKYACNFENNRRIDLKFHVCVLKYMYITKMKLKKIDFLKILTVYNPLTQAVSFCGMVFLSLVFCAISFNCGILISYRFK